MTRSTASALALGMVAAALAAAVVGQAWLVPVAVTVGVALAETLGGRYWPAESGRRTAGRVSGRAASCGGAAAFLLVMAGSLGDAWLLRALAGPALAAVLIWVLSRSAEVARS